MMFSARRYLYSAGVLGCDRGIYRFDRESRSSRCLCRESLGFWVTHDCLFSVFPLLLYNVSSDARALGSGIMGIFSTSCRHPRRTPAYRAPCLSRLVRVHLTWVFVQQLCLIGDVHTLGDRVLHFIANLLTLRYSGRAGGLIVGLGVDVSLVADGAE